MPGSSQRVAQLDCGKVILRQVVEGDLDTLFGWMQDADLLRAINRTQITTPDSHRAWYQRILTDDSQTVFSIEQKETGALIGQCGLRHIDLMNRKAELWIFIGDAGTRGSGYGGDAVRGLLRHAFKEKGMNRISVYVVSFNKGACRFYERLGFRLEGNFRQDILVNGCFYDTIHMAVLNEEYELSVE